MKSFAQLQQETSAVQLGFLLTDIVAAHTFLDVAGTTRDLETRSRNVQHAEEAYTTVRRMSARVRTSTAQATDLDNRLNLLKQRIQGMEQARKL